ncbi:hypothetical protein ABT160_33375 [Streptomyces sp. NPDC001941]|uniref:hypothetical protein n=1 Tax=Streptomyces sp. NPDC001941 TaxID=3154659 RepID=UPI0033189B5D
MELDDATCPWNESLMCLFEDVYGFAAVGPRRHDDWTHDVVAVLRREVGDPRGWLQIDMDLENSARDSIPSYPFALPDAVRLPEHLHPIAREAAVGALAVMSEEWDGECYRVRSRPDKDVRLNHARTVLDRFGPAAGYWTNSSLAVGHASPDFVAASLRGTRSHSFVTSEYINGLDLVADFGLIAVNDSEVGAFWAVEAI